MSKTVLRHDYYRSLSAQVMAGQKNGINILKVKTTWDGIKVSQTGFELSTNRSEVKRFIGSANVPF